jgi:ElaB/YqjD/DUF883 family membrane-anchored ribosome-binding protein
MTISTPALDTSNHGALDGAASPKHLLKRASEQASALAHQGLDTWNASSQQLRERAHQASDNTVGYIKEKPYTSVLIAAGAGAALMAIVALLARPRY